MNGFKTPVPKQIFTPKKKAIGTASGQSRFTELAEEFRMQKEVELNTIILKSGYPYNGIFSRRQMFAVLSQKHGDYFSRILIFAVGNVREK